jgi:hypothetical protein
LKTLGLQVRNSHICKRNFFRKNVCQTLKMSDESDYSEDFDDTFEEESVEAS